MTQLLRRIRSCGPFRRGEVIALLPMTDMSGPRFLPTAYVTRSLPFDCPMNPVHDKVVTLSIGSASWAAGKQLDRDTLVAKAVFVALYRAKNAGRNRTCAAETDYSSGACSGTQRMPGERRRIN